ncbi:uncharacterized protein ACBT44_012426 isoform 1-T1 [Syngnathus typhle]
MTEDEQKDRGRWQLETLLACGRIFLREAYWMLGTTKTSASPPSLLPPPPTRYLSFLPATTPPALIPDTQRAAAYAHHTCAQAHGWMPGNCWREKEQRGKMEAG